VRLCEVMGLHEKQCKNLVQYCTIKTTVLLSQALCMLGSLRNLMFKLHAFVVNTKFAQATYYMLVPSTEELYCLIRQPHPTLSNTNIAHCKTLIPPYFILSTNIM